MQGDTSRSLSSRHRGYVSRTRRFGVRLIQSIHGWRSSFHVPTHPLYVTPHIRLLDNELLRNEIAKRYLGDSFIYSMNLFQSICYPLKSNVGISRARQRVGLDALVKCRPPQCGTGSIFLLDLFLRDSDPHYMQQPFFRGG